MPPSIFFPHRLTVLSDPAKGTATLRCYMYSEGRYITRTVPLTQAGYMLDQMLTNGIGVDDPLRGGHDYTSPDVSDN